MDCRGLRPRNFEKEKQSKLRTRNVKQSTVSESAEWIAAAFGLAISKKKNNRNCEREA